VPHASVNGVRLYYEERGSGTPILGIHGGGSSAVFWEDAAERLAELGRVIIYDRRGSNRSDRPDPLTAEDSPEAIRRGSEALADVLPGARHARVGGDHAIDPAGPEVLAFIAEVPTTART
jgi:pimeloyl-ACP methyl ester carboxylesterase